MGSIVPMKCWNVRRRWPRGVASRTCSGRRGTSRGFHCATARWTSCSVAVAASCRRPGRAITEAVRVLRPGGRLLVLDLRKHDQKWVTTKFGDRWLGFTEAELERLLRDAGLRDVRAQVGAKQSGDPFVVLIASGAKPIQPVSKPDTSTTPHPPQARRPIAPSARGDLSPNRKADDDDSRTVARPARDTHPAP